MEMNQILERLDALYAENRLDQAEIRLREWLRDAIDSGNRGAALTLYNELEGLCRTTGRAQEAVGISEKALQLVHQMGLDGTVHHATTVLNGATANRAAGNLERALDMYQEASAIYKKLGQENSYQMFALYNNISQIYQEQNRHEEALSCLGRALTGVLAMGGGDAEAATTRVNMSLSLTALNRLEEAEKRLEEGMAYYRSEKGKGDSHYGSALAAAGALAFGRGEKEKAISLFQEALEATLRIFGENDACRVIRKNLEAIQES